MPFKNLLRNIMRNKGLEYKETGKIILSPIWVEDHSPRLTRLRIRLATEHPFKDITLGVCLPGTWETFMLISAMEAGGASIFFAPLYCKPEVRAEIKKTTVELMTGRDREVKIVRKSNFLYDTSASFGQFVTQEKVKVKGIVEQTSSGISIYADYDSKGLLRQPVFNLDSSFVKRVRENRFAAGLGLVEALLKLRLFLPSKRVFIVGYGNVGSGCALQLKRIGCTVDVYDIDPYKMLEAEAMGYHTGTLKELLPLADIVVTATGALKPALRSEEINLLKHGAILANVGGAGWDRRELLSKRTVLVGDQILKVFRDDTSYIYELTQGHPVNLIIAAGTDTETMDRVFSLGVLTMEYLVKNYEILPKHVLPVPEEIQLQVF